MGPNALAHHGGHSQAHRLTGDDAMESNVFATALAEVWVVPNRAIMLTTTTRPSWKKLFSMADGMPMRRIFPIMAPFSRSRFRHVTRSSSLGRMARARMTMAATPRDTNVGIGHAFDVHF